MPKEIEVRFTGVVKPSGRSPTRASVFSGILELTTTIRKGGICILPPLQYVMPKYPLGAELVIIQSLVDNLKTQGSGLMNTARLLS